MPKSAKRPAPLDVGDNSSFRWDNTGGSTVISSAVNSSLGDGGEVDPARSTCDVSKVLTVVRKKMATTGSAYRFLRYVVYSILYFSIVLLQRDSEAASSVQNGVREYFMAGYRSEVTLEMKKFMDIKTVEDFWDWHLLAFCPGLIFVQTLSNGEPLPVHRTNTILQHNRLTSGFRMMQRRGKSKKCQLDDKWSVFAPECTERTYLEGRVGPVSTEPFKGAFGATYTYQEFDVGAGVKDGGFFQTFKGSPAECARISELKRQR